MFFVFLGLVQVTWSSCWVSTDASDDVMGRCPLSACLSTEYAMRTGLAHVCSSAPSLACLTLLLMDAGTVKRLGFEVDAVVNASEAVTAEASAAAVFSNHVDLGWLPRVTKQEFVRLYTWAASRALPVAGERALVILPLPFRCRVEFDRAQDAFVVLRQECAN